MKKNCKTLFALFALSGISTLSQASTLQDIYDQALLNDHTYRAAQANLDAGRENTKLGRSGLLPKINAQGDWEDSTTNQDGDSSRNNDLGVLVPVEYENDNTRTGYAVSLVQPLFDMNAWHTYKRSKAFSSIAEAEFKLAEQDLIVRSSQAYFDALQAADNLETAKAEENAFSHQLEQTRQRFEVGLTAITEVHEAQAVYDSSVAERFIAEGRLGISFEALEVITGRPHYQLSPLKEDLPVTPPTPADRGAWVDLAMQNNYTLQVASLNSDAAKQNAKAQKAGHYPKLTGNLTYSNYNNELSGASGTIEDMDTENQAIGITLTIPIYNGGGISASRRQAAQQFIAAREQLSQAQRDIVQTTRSIHLTVTTSVTTVKARAQAITSNQSALEATQAGYDVGTRDLVDVLNAQRNLYRAQRDYYDALYAYVISTLRLKQAAGTLSANDIAELNQWLDTARKVSREI